MLAGTVETRKYEARLAAAFRSALLRQIPEASKDLLDAQSAAIQRVLEGFRSSNLRWTEYLKATASENPNDVFFLFSRTGDNALCLYVGALLNRATRIDPQLRDDIVQDVLFKFTLGSGRASLLAWIIEHSGDPKSCYGYLSKSAQNEQKRIKKTEPAVSFDEALDEGVDPPPLDAATERSALDRLLDLAEEHRNRILRQAWLSLEEKQREVLWHARVFRSARLAEFDMARHEEDDWYGAKAAAEGLGITVNSFNVQVNRAKSALRKAIMVELTKESE